MSDIKDMKTMERPIIIVSFIAASAVCFCVYCLTQCAQTVGTSWPDCSKVPGSIYCRVPSQLTPEKGQE